MATRPAPLNSWPDNVKVQCTDYPFDATAGDMLDYLKSWARRWRPRSRSSTRSGSAGSPMDLLVRLGQSPKCELFVNMIINTAKRFATAGLIDKSLDAAGLHSRDRVMYLHDLYAEQLRDVAGTDYIQSFEMINLQGQTLCRCNGVLTSDVSELIRLGYYLAIWGRALGQPATRHDTRTVTIDGEPVPPE